MAYYRSISVLCTVICLTFLFCSHKKQLDNETCLIGTDTLSNAIVATLAPDSISPKDKIIRVALELVLIKKNDNCFQKDNNGSDKRLFSDLTNQLTLQTGVTWSFLAAKNLYTAAKVLKCHVDMNSSERVITQLDSTFSKNKCTDTILVKAITKRISHLSTLENIRSQKDFESLIILVFQMSPQMGSLITEFLYSEEKEQLQATKVLGKIKGLVARDSVKMHKANATLSTKEVPPVDPALALRIRTKESISDSIKKHIPTIEALYKKELKSHPQMQGIVWVTFSISPNGTVASTQIRSEGISEKGFIDPFSSYIKKIHFKNIPENLGIMTFEFPFEFAPEN